MSNFEEVLYKLGYDLKSENARFWRARPVYRSSANDTSLRISKETGYFKDFSANIGGSFKELVRMSLGLPSLKKADEWLGENEIEFQYVEFKPKVKNKKRMRPEDYSQLLPHYSFYEKRDIDIDILKKIECGVEMAGKMGNRFVFVIRDEEDEVVGLAGRDLIGNRDHKWKLLGLKGDWVYPRDVVVDILEQNKVYIVESVGDMLALNNAGIFNVLVIFGVTISAKQVNYIASLGCHVVIATNNDNEKKENWGCKAAETIKEKLLKLVDEEKVSIKLPTLNDWGATPKNEIIEQLL